MAAARSSTRGAIAMWSSAGWPAWGRASKAPGSSSAAARGPIRCQGPFARLRLGLLVAMSVLGLLLALVHVVGQGVRAGGERRAAAAQHDDAAWRCSHLHGRGLRDACLRQLDARPSATAPALAQGGP
jgi:hypothetical protein